MVSLLYQLAIVLAYLYDVAMSYSLWLAKLLVML